MSKPVKQNISSIATSHGTNVPVRAAGHKSEEVVEPERTKGVLPENKGEEKAIAEKTRDHEPKPERGVAQPLPEATEGPARIKPKLEAEETEDEV